VGRYNQKLLTLCGSENNTIDGRSVVYQGNLVRSSQSLYCGNQVETRGGDSNNQQYGPHGNNGCTSDDPS
jgi:hypothetical protein